MLIERARKAFIGATTAKKYKAALRLAGRLRGHDQLVILDSLFEAAKRLGVERTTGEPLGMRQQLDGSVIVTWSTTTKRPDGSEVKAVSTAQIEPADEGCGWVGTEEVPDVVVDAVTAAAMNNELRAKSAKKGKRIYVKSGGSGVGR